MKKSVTVIVLTGTLALSGCASNGGLATSASGGCNMGMSSTVGALLGAAAGYAASKNNDNSSAQNNRAIALGAAAGGALGAGICVAINARTVQTQSATQVEQAYKQQYGALPDKTSVQNYTIGFNSGSNVVRANDKVTLQSAVKVVEGQQEPLKSVKETMVLKNEAGKVLNTVTKDITQTGAYGSGAFENSFTWAFPANVSKGKYIVETELLVNGNKVATKRQPITLV